VCTAHGQAVIFLMFAFLSSRTLKRSDLQSPINDNRLQSDWLFEENEKAIANQFKMHANI
jgi:hypothetical protein